MRDRVQGVPINMGIKGHATGCPNKHEIWKTPVAGCPITDINW